MTTYDNCLIGVTSVTNDMYRWFVEKMLSLEKKDILIS